MLKTKAEIITLVEQYTTILQNKFPHHIERVILYGSCARGTHHDESDIDVMVTVDWHDEHLTESEERIKFRRKLKNQFEMIAYNVGYEQDEILGTLIMSENQFDKWSPIGESIRDDGIDIWRNGHAPLQQYNMKNEEVIQDKEQAIKHFMIMADEAIESAERNYQWGDNLIAVSKGYYAMFYAAKAFLLSIGITSKKHKGTVASFNQYVVNTGMIEKKYHTWLAWAMNARQGSNYNPFKGYDEHATFDKVMSDAAVTAESTINHAKQFVAKMRELLKGNNNDTDE